MEFIIAQLLNAILFPPGIFVILIAVSLWLSKTHLHLAKRLLAFTALILYLLSTTIVSELLITPLEKYAALDFKVAQDIPADAIVILSAGRLRNADEYGGKDVSGNHTMGRLLYGVRLHIATQLPILLTGGLSEEHRVPLSELMANDLFFNFGIHETWQENKSSNTAENALFSRDILFKEDKKHIFLVTDAWHMTRAVDSFEKQGFIVTPAPTRFLGRNKASDDFELLDLLPHMHALEKSYFAMHEFFGIFWYKLRY